jgi:hypothetical protein
LSFAHLGPVLTLFLVVYLQDHPKDDDFFNKTIINYHEMHTIFVGGIAMGEFAMGSNDPLGIPSPLLEERENTQEYHIIIINGPNKASTSQVPSG